MNNKVEKNITLKSKELLAGVVLAAICLYALISTGLDLHKSRVALDKMCGDDRSLCIKNSSEVMVGLFSGQPSVVEIYDYATMTPMPSMEP